MLKYSMLYPENTCSRRSVNLSGMWRFQTDPQSCGVEQGWNDGLPAPDMIPVPASFADFYTDKETREFCGDFWYETDVFVPDEWKGREIDLRFGTVRRFTLTALRLRRMRAVFFHSALESQRSRVMAQTTGLSFSATMN